MFFQVPNFEFLSEKLMMYQTQHNEVIRGYSLDLVFFTDAMTHLVKVRLEANLTDTYPVEKATDNSDLFEICLHIDITYHSNGQWKCPACGSGRIREAEPDSPGLIHSWIQHLPDHVDKVKRENNKTAVSICEGSYAARR